MGTKDIGAFLTGEDVERFHGRFVAGAAGQCWEWDGARDCKGYGYFTIKISGEWCTVFAHRVAYAMAHLGANPKMVCHSCDNPPCVNPAHLWAGDAKANYDDAMSKGRNPRFGAQPGESSLAKLTRRQVEEIRRIGDDGTIPIGKLAKRYGVTRTTIVNILSYVTWDY